jgi:energy-coupling factor transporter ATP-binding protein EcfA2
MDVDAVNDICSRRGLINDICDKMQYIEDNKYKIDVQKGIYVYGPPGSGKTRLIKHILKLLNYDMVYYSASDIRNKTVIDSITKYNMANVNVLSMFEKKKKKIAIVMDEIDGMNSGDKGGITGLIKLIRPKKTKKQKQEAYTFNPVICIGHHHFDKKIKDLMKVCHVFEVTAPSVPQINLLLDRFMPDLDHRSRYINYFQGDLFKFRSLFDLYAKKGGRVEYNSVKALLNQKSYNEDIKNTTKYIINNDTCISDHNHLVNETDRTIVALLWHENIIDMFGKFPHKEVVDFYISVLENMCFADFIDRITFQKQIWQFNEMSSLIKTMRNNSLTTDVRFTKVLTKYSTEFNNYQFLYGLTQKLMMDKKDVLGFFTRLRASGSDADMLGLVEELDIVPLDVNRMYRILDRFSGADE